MSRDVLTRSAREPDRTMTFGPGQTQLYDVWLAPAASVTVVLVHGGFWRAEWDRTHLRPLATALADAGFAVALPEYRRTGMPGGTWPGPGQDLTAALAMVRADEGLPEPTLLVGHSAGGHLAVWLLHRPEAAGLLGAVSLAGCLDLRMVGRLGLDDGAADALMGGTDWQQQPFLGSDPIDLGPTPTPVALLHGRADQQVPLALSESWMATCGTPGRDVLTVLDDSDHFDLIDPESAAWPALLTEIIRLTGSGRTA
ncbi:alpha/beta hydrolase family protein [Ornithinimicrobium murale]|uniref:alpha/beta hydrolase family protein n=1 Tax=Ornithinimicrobium murale TaxID=1050153 RepID=UPI00192DF6E0|nr:alpha/beta hydrolase fold domain-containing protein [Ornithinimicrobium murale]